MLAANAELDGASALSTTLGSQLDQLSDTLDVETDKRVAGEYALIDIRVQKTSGIIATDA